MCSKKRMPNHHSGSRLKPGWQVHPTYTRTNISTAFHSNEAPHSCSILNYMPITKFLVKCLPNLPKTKTCDILQSSETEPWRKSLFKVISPNTQSIYPSWSVDSASGYQPKKDRNCPKGKATTKGPTISLFNMSRLDFSVLKP